MTDQTDGVVTLRERVRERLIDLVDEALMAAANPPEFQFTSPSHDAADAILREFAIRPVAWGRVGEDGEVEPG